MTWPLQTIAADRHNDTDTQPYIITQSMVDLYSPSSCFFFTTTKISLCQGIWNIPLSSETEKKCMATERERERERERETDRDRQTDRQRHRERERDRDREK